MTTALTKSMAAGKRIRPPNLSLGIDRRSLNNTILDFEPAVVDNQSPISDDELQLSSPESASSGSPTRFYLHPDPAADELSKDLAVLKQLRKSVQTNLRLRPIRSINSLPKVQISPHPPSADPWRDNAPNSANSASPTSAASIYYTPMLETPHSPFTGRSTPNAQLLYDLPTRPQEARPLDPISLVERLDNSTKSRPLIIDTRPQPAYISSHIKHSINIVIPSLILKRFRKPNGGFQTLDTLRQFITTEQGQEAWDQLIGPSGIWDGDVVVYDEEMLVKDKDSGQSPAWALLPIITPLLSFGSLYYLAGGISAALRYPTILSSSSPSPETDMPRKLSVPGGGLFQLDTQLSARSQTFPEIDRPKPPPLRSPLSPVSSAMPTTTSSIIIDSDPSPPPSQAGFRKPPPTRRPSVPNLNRIVTTSAERLNVNGPLPKLQLRTQPVRSATLAVPSLYSTSLQPPPSPSYPPRSPRSPSALTLAHSNHLPSGSAHWSTTTPSPTRSTFGESESSHLPPPSPKLPRPSPPHSPRTPMPTSPLTARPDLDPPTTEEAFPTFTVSTILPNFLYLGPELTLPEHVEELQELGVKRILNIAVECDDDHGLNLREVFERYIRIPMRDTVEEDNIARGVREVCEILDDARLHSAPTYVHCKAGKSRSVTAVMAYLIHANHWTLSRAYSFVLERRKGISPNIGFVSELMTFEEEELGGKSIGVQPNVSGNDGDGDGAGKQASYVVAAGNRRQGHIRESLPPAFTTPDSGPISAGAVVLNGHIGDSGQDMEIKDATGRYRHARRAPVNENTLQPMRRVSKAGLESSHVG